MSLFKLLAQATGAPPILRIGGSQVDTMVWSATGNGRNAAYVSPADITPLAQFMAATGWQCIYGINLASTAAGSSPMQTTALAQAECVAVTAAFNTAGALPPWFEIGNECDDYGHSGHPTTA